MHAIVTGASGFLGRHLVAVLEDCGHSVVTLGTGQGLPGRKHLQVSGLDDVEHHEALLLTLAPAPNWIFHLAGTTKNDDLELVNVVWAKTLLEAVARLAPMPQTILVGSAAEYGPQGGNAATHHGRWVTEDSPAAPASPYGRSKLEQTMVGLRAAQRQPVVVARPFNLVGPGMPAHLALGNFVRQAVTLPEAGSGLPRKICTGPLHAIRDFVHVASCAATLLKLASHPAAAGHIVNICTGKGTSLQTVADTLMEQLTPPVELDSAKADSVGPDVVVGSTDKLRDLDIEPDLCDISKCIADMLSTARAARSPCQ